MRVIFVCGTSQTDTVRGENMSDSINRQAAVDVIRKCNVKEVTPAYMLIDKAEAMTELMKLPSAQPDMAENLYLYKCYITDKDGLQHEVIHTGDIRRVTGWEI